MKRVMHGKVYDTDTAVRLGTWESHPNDPADFAAVEESLYR